MTKRSVTMPVGVVMRRTPGVTRWARWVWRATAVLPGAGPAEWRELRRDGEAADYHAATVPLELHRTDTEAYMVSLSMTPPTIFVILRPDHDPGSPHEVAVHGVTMSAYEAQDHLDSGEEQVEPTPAPPGLVAWVRDFCEAHHHQTPFVKRRRDRAATDRKEDGIGDARVRQPADIYRPPGQLKPGRPKPNGSDG